MAKPIFGSFIFRFFALAAVEEAFIQSGLQASALLHCFYYSLHYFLNRGGAYIDLCWESVAHWHPVAVDINLGVLELIRLEDNFLTSGRPRGRKGGERAGGRVAIGGISMQWFVIFKKEWSKRGIGRGGRGLRMRFLVSW